MLECNRGVGDLFVDKCIYHQRFFLIFFFSSRRRHTRCSRDWSSDVCSSDLTVLRSAESLGSDTSLLRQVTGRFALAGAGTYRLRVSGAPYYPYDLNYGPYRLFLYRINRRPETLPHTLAFGDRLSGETIDLPGDVDEFRVTVPDSSGANLVAELATQPAEGTGLSVYLVDRATGATATAAALYTAGVRASPGRVVLPPGTYTLRVDVSHYQDRPVLRGAYRIWLYRFGLGPELVPNTFAIGDTVAGEVIDPWGDADRFHFYGVRGQHVRSEEHTSELQSRLHLV